MERFTESFEPLTLKEIEEFEATKGINIPKKFKEFLLDSNGGFPEPNEFLISDEQGSSCVNILFGIHSEKFDNLSKYVERYKNRLPKGFIPIGDDPGGNLLCVGIEGEYTDQIHFWDHEEELDEDGNSRMDMKNMYFLASNIFEFLDKLTDSKNEE